ncbi:DUF6517 family protein [Halalkalicoccus tibetensis]|uniref:DUF6517 family protein n=1 Tax=Halalkalicoccus tibetensis TaxID=175632 RepID=A0ABD5V6V4_9EURY
MSPEFESEAEGEELVSAEPSPIAVDTTAVERAGYEETRDIVFEVTQTMAVGDESYVVRAANHLIEYERSVDHPEVGKAPIARFTAVATPKVEAFSQEINFTEQVTDEVIGNGLQIGYENVEIGDEVHETDSVTPFERETKVYQYPGTAEVDDYVVYVYLHVARTVRESDYITLAGIYPQAFVANEQHRVLDLMEAVK